MIPVIQSKPLYCIIAAIAVCLLSGVVWFIRTPAAPYYLALVVPASGQHLAYGNTIVRSVEEYLAQINTRGGVAGKPVAVKVFDEPADPASAARLAGRIADGVPTMRRASSSRAKAPC